MNELQDVPFLQDGGLIIVLMNKTMIQLRDHVHFEFLIAVNDIGHRAVFWNFLWKTVDNNSHINQP